MLHSKVAGSKEGKRQALDVYFRTRFKYVDDGERDRPPDTAIWVHCQMARIKIKKSACNERLKHSDRIEGIKKRCEGCHFYAEFVKAKVQGNGPVNP